MRWRMCGKTFDLGVLLSHSIFIQEHPRVRLGAMDLRELLPFRPTPVPDKYISWQALLWGWGLG